MAVTYSRVLRRPKERLAPILANAVNSVLCQSPVELTFFPHYKSLMHPSPSSPVDSNTSSVNLDQTFYVLAAGRGGRVGKNWGEKKTKGINSEEEGRE